MRTSRLRIHSRSACSKRVSTGTPSSWSNAGDLTEC
jgi:hypothetical protein